MAHAHYTVGEGYSSATIQAAIDLVDGDLSFDGGGIRNVDVYYCDADDHSVPYAETLNIYTGFSNGSATDYIDVGAMVSHGGMPNSGILIDVTSAVVSERCILMGVTQTRFHGFGISGVISCAANINIIENYSKTGLIYDNILYNCSQAGSYVITGISYSGGGTSTTDSRVYNNQIISLKSTPEAWAKQQGLYLGVHATSGHECIVANNSFYISDNNIGVGFNGGGANYVSYSNNYSSAYATKCFIDIGLTGCTLNYNISSDGTADDFGGTGNLVNKAAVDQFECVTAGSENLQLRYTSACYRKGQDNSALFTTDCAGNTWNHWETGALAKQYARIYNVDGDEKDQITSNGVIIP